MNTSWIIIRKVLHNILKERKEIYIQYYISKKSKPMKRTDFLSNNPFFTNNNPYM